MLPFQVAIVLLTFIAASIFALLHGSAAIVSYHIIFAIGVAPLILGAMVHFVPVLTRSKHPGSIIATLPMVAFIGGILVTSHFAFPQAALHGQYVGAAIIAMVVTILGYWAHQLGSKSVGTPHPCLNWYLAAMACLLIALGAILTGYFIPGQRTSLRLLHLHLNTMGFIGITALGTLQVLLPTTAQKADSGTGTRMRRNLKWTVAGTVLIACGAAWHPSIAWLGLTMLAIPLFHILKSWLPLYADEIFTIHGATSALATALCGYLAAMMLGAGQAYYDPSFNPVATFIIAFLMPLVTGAVSYLLPLWLRPGRQTDWHQSARKHLEFSAGLRATILLMSGVIAGLGYRVGWGVAAIAISAFLAQVILMLLKTRPPSSL